MCVSCLIDVVCLLDGYLKMIFSTVFCLSILIASTAEGKDYGGGYGGGYDSKDYKNKRCLTGYMTDLQDWVDEYGSLRDTREINMSSLVVSQRNNAMRQVQQKINRFDGSRVRRIKYLSMAHCRLTRVPSIFNLSVKSGPKLEETLEYITFYGNNFGMIYIDDAMYDVSMNASNTNEISIDGQYMRKQLTMWSVGFHGFVFQNLKELDLRSCSIQALGNHSFQRMPALQYLYLGENIIHYIEANTFNFLTALKHLDLSRNRAHDADNIPKEIRIDKMDLFNDINVESLDLSFTYLGSRNIDMIKSIEHSVIRMSLCYTGLIKIREDHIVFKQLKYLDVSGNSDILCSTNFMRSLKDTLQILYAEGVGMKNMDGFHGFSKLEVLQLTGNEITEISSAVASSLSNLQILDLDNNKMSRWFDNIFSSMKNLKLLSLRNNNINIITRDMYYDIEDLMYIGLSGNFFACNCFVRQIFEVGLRSEMGRNERFISSISNNTDNFTNLHTGFSDFNEIIRKRNNITNFCDKESNCKVLSASKLAGNYLFFDFNDYLDKYQCLSVSNGKTSDVMKLPSCSRNSRDFDMQEKIRGGWNKLLLLLLMVLLLPLLYLIYIFRKNFRYFLITVKNSATLSLISKHTVPLEGAIFNYDVFVSYCNEDRAWVLDQLLPHVEKDCNISVCLHERDFQVGLSILENIVSCMDRSRSIMLIISKRFLLSQWCQFEMHLAQHRLLETRREDLILILLEEIPRRLRPNTLHYLMLTKTYIVWPKAESEKTLFWRRMKKSLVTHVAKYQENVSLA